MVTCLVLTRNFEVAFSFWSLFLLLSLIVKVFVIFVLLPWFKLLVHHHRPIVEDFSPLGKFFLRLFSV